MMCLISRSTWFAIHDNALHSLHHYHTTRESRVLSIQQTVRLNHCQHSIRHVTLCTFAANALAVCHLTSRARLTIGFYHSTKATFEQEVGQEVVVCFAQTIHQGLVQLTCIDKMKKYGNHFFIHIACFGKRRNRRVVSCIFDVDNMFAQV
jgi:hypothetical protein